MYSNHSCNTSTFVLTVPPEIINQVTTVSAELRSDVVLNCEASGDPDPDITWYRDGNNLGLNDDNERYEGKLTKPMWGYMHCHVHLYVFRTTHRVAWMIQFPFLISVTGENSLLISNVTLDDAGAYHCQADNDVGSATLNVHLQIVGQC